ncbi:MAG: ligase-associated DNA damage response exonuclease [Acidobacteriota bacterium]|nr:ligase-associated DNA damage response exonuclease [Acidobacteriota bacterium]
MLRVTDSGVYCEAGGFFIDPWRPVDRAIITHAHADHARRGSAAYLGSQAGERLLRRRLGDEAVIETLEYGEAVTLGEVRVSLHPAGHVLGSAQVRLEHRGEVWVVSGDYKVAPDPTCAAFEAIPCDVFVTESTFGLPIFRWPSQEEVFEQIGQWWRGNREVGKTSVLFAYSLGKAQRLLAGIDATIGPIYTHGAVELLNQEYRESGVELPATAYVGDGKPEGGWAGSLVVAPPGAGGTPWMRRFGTTSTGFASGWTRIRGTRRRRSMDRGFVFSDHADWPGLLSAIEATGAQRVWVTHGYRLPLVRWLQEQGLEAEPVATSYEMAEEEDAAGAGEESGG